MEKEFIVETQSESVYHLTYNKRFYQRTGRFTVKQLFAKKGSVTPGEQKLFGIKIGSEVFFNENMDIHHLILGAQLDLTPEGGAGGMGGLKISRPIIKIFERIH